MPEPVTLFAIFLIGVVASFIGAVTGGGGGLLSISFLIFLGLPPQMAIATNRMGAIGLSVGAFWKFWRGGKIQWRYVLQLALLGVSGAFIGANILIHTDNGTLTLVVGAILLLLLPLIFINRSAGIVRRETTGLQKAVGYTIYFLISIFSGFFGSGAGLFVMYVLMTFFGLTIIESNATDITPWLILSIVAFAVFAGDGIVDYTLGAVLFLGMLVGGYLGASTALKKGDRWVKAAFAVVVAAIGIKLLLFP